MASRMAWLAPLVLWACGEDNPPLELRLELSDCTGAPQPSEGCGGRLRAAVADGTNACVVVESAGASAHAVWRWSGRGQVTPLGEVTLSVEGPIEVAVFLTSSPIDAAACRRRRVDDPCDGGCLARLRQVGAAGDVFDFQPSGDCRVEGPAVAAERCDALDDDCDGRIDEALVCAHDAGLVDSGLPGDGSVLDGGALDGRPGADLAPPDGGPRDGASHDDAAVDAQPGASIDMRADADPPDRGCVPRIEACNGLDDDCDGPADEGLAPRPCWADGVDPAALDPVRSLCTAGETHCLDGTWSECDGEGPRDERCHDGLDQDCDGSADEACWDGPCDDDADCPLAPAYSVARCEGDLPGGRCAFGTPGVAPPDGIGCRCIECRACLEDPDAPTCDVICARCAARAAACTGDCIAGDDGLDRCGTICLDDGICRPGWACRAPVALVSPQLDERGAVTAVVVDEEGFGGCSPANR